MTYGGHFDGEDKERELDELNKKTLESTFWDDREESSKVIKKISRLKNKIEPLQKEINEIKDYLELIPLMTDKEINEIDINKINEETEKLEKSNLFSGKYDDLDVIMEIHSGAGGTEACDWAEMLFRMYTRWCEKKAFAFKVLDRELGDVAGIKSITLEIDGENTYGLLKSEKGVHRLVRISPFDSNKRRHTSFASVEVMPKFDETPEIEIDPKDLKIDVYRSSGKGGQGVNTTDSAVRVTHMPTGLVVTCQNERSQMQNKEEAINVLKSKLMNKRLAEEEEKLNKIKGIEKSVEFGSQIRSYVLEPYKMVKDHRTNVETSNADKVLDGDIDIFIDAYLRDFK